MLFLLVVPSFPIHYPASTAFVITALPLNSNLCLLNSLSAGFDLDPHFLYCCLKIASKQKNQGNQMSHLVCFPSLRDHNLVLPVFQCLKIIIS